MPLLNARSTSAPARASTHRSPVWRSRLVGGDAEAFSGLYRRHHQALYRYCRSLLGNEEDAHDALQSTMEHAFSALQREKRDIELRPWLFRIAHNESISLIRRRHANYPLDAAATVGQDSLTAEVAAREDLRQLRADLAELGDRQRATLVMRELSGLSHGEIAAVLDTTPAAVKQTIFEARCALQEGRAGRAMACDDVRRVISDGDGRVLRGRKLRAHLRDCAGCREFRQGLQERPALLALLAPALPSAVGASMLGHLVGAGGKAAGVAAGGSGGAGATFAVGACTKAVLAVVAVAGVSAGAVALSPHRVPVFGASRAVKVHVRSSHNVISTSPRSAGGIRSAVPPAPVARHAAGAPRASLVANPVASTGHGHRAGYRSSPMLRTTRPKPHPVGRAGSHYSAAKHNPHVRRSKGRKPRGRSNGPHSRTILPHASQGPAQSHGAAKKNSSITVGVVPRGRSAG